MTKAEILKSFSISGAEPQAQTPASKPGFALESMRKVLRAHGRLSADDTNSERTHQALRS